MSSKARLATSGGRVFCSMMERSRFTKSPPLKPAMGISSLSGSKSISMPFGGRPLVMAKRMPASCRLWTAAWARSVRIFCSVTSVPSTSAAVALQQLVRRRRPRRAGLVVREVLGRRIGPGVDDRLHDLPARLDIVGPLEQRRIAAHAVVQQSLVAGAGTDLEEILVGEIHAA